MGCDERATRSLLVGPAQQQGRQLGAVAHGECADRPPPRQGRSARRHHGVDQPGGRGEAPRPHLAEAVGERLGEQVGVDGVHVDLAPTGLRVVQPALGALAEEGGDPGHQPVDDRRVDVQAQPGPGQLTAGEDHRVVARQDPLVQQRDPLRAVGCGHDDVPGRGGQDVEPAEPSCGLGDPVREERVGAPGVGGGEAVVEHRLDVQVADPLDARLAQQPEGEDQIGVGVGVDPVAGQRGRQHQPRRHARRGVAQVGQHRGGEGDEVVGDGPHDPRTLSDRSVVSHRRDRAVRDERAKQSLRTS